MEKATEEKIDYIYNHIRKEEKMLFWKRLTKFLMYLFFIAYLAYFYFIGFEKFKNTIIEAVKPNINSEKVIEGFKENSGDVLNKIKKSDFIKKILKSKKEENINLENY